MTKYMDNIYLGDSYKLIKEIPDKSIDLIYTDPPYKFGKYGKNKSFGDRLKEQQKIRDETAKAISEISNGIDNTILDEYCRVLKHIHIYIWCNDKQILDYLNYFVAKGCTYTILVWEKTNVAPFYAKRWLDDVEYCLLFKDKNAHFEGQDTYYNSQKCYTSPMNVADKKKYVHPTIKPMECVMRHLTKSLKQGSVVLDTFAGSGTTLVACKELGFHYIGFEINEKYYKIAKDRLNGIDQHGNTDLFKTDFTKL